jgi:hypothetical protein
MKARSEVESKKRDTIMPENEAYSLGGRMKHLQENDTETENVSLNSVRALAFTSRRGELLLWGNVKCCPVTASHGLSRMGLSVIWGDPE